MINEPITVTTYSNKVITLRQKNKQMISITHDRPLGDRNTFKMQVSCRLYIEYDSPADLKELDFGNMPMPVKHLGSGSNLLFTKDFNGTLLHSRIDFIERLPGDLFSVGAGMEFDRFCGLAAEEGFWGPENLSLIPGEVGAAAVQNIGAYGVEAKDIIKTVHAFDTKSGEFVEFDVSECGYGYRESRFKGADKDRFVITHVVFALSRKPAPRLDYSKALGYLKDDPALTPMKVRDAVIAIRKEKLPDPAEIGSAGSFFKNPVISKEAFGRIVSESDVEVPHYKVTDDLIKVPAAWLIEQCGWKGKHSGGAAVWEKQPLVIVNASGNATPHDIMELEDKIRSSVNQKFGITLDCEVEHI